jgi:hypothetical protein
MPLKPRGRRVEFDNLPEIPFQVSNGRALQGFVPLVRGHLLPAYIFNIIMENSRSVP